MEKVKIPADRFGEVISSYRERYGYNKMSDEEKSEFDEKLASVIEIDENTEVSDDDQNDDGEHAIGQKVLRMRR